MKGHIKVKPPSVISLTDRQKVTSFELCGFYQQDQRHCSALSLLLKYWWLLNTVNDFVSLACFIIGASADIRNDTTTPQGEQHVYQTAFKATISHSLALSSASRTSLWVILIIENVWFLHHCPFLQPSSESGFVTAQKQSGFQEQ